MHMPMSPERYSELIKLKAENDALHSLLKKKKQELEEEVETVISFVIALSDTRYHVVW